MLIICGKSFDCDKLEDDRNMEYEKKKPKLVEKIAPYIIHPMRPKKLLFDLIIGIFYLMSYLVDPFIFAFYYEPYEYRNIHNLQMVVTFASSWASISKEMASLICLPTFHFSCTLQS